MLLRRLHSGCHHCSATSRLCFISLTAPQSPGQLHCQVEHGPRLTRTIRGKLASASMVMHGKAEILSQEQGGWSQP